MKVLICSHKSEPQVEKVWKLLKAQGKEVIVFERYRKDHYLSFQYGDSNATACLNVEGNRYELNSEVFPHVWLWMKPIISGEIVGESVAVDEKFKILEWKMALSCMESFLGQSKFINPFTVNRQLSLKPFQLKLAAEMGLTIPATVISNYLPDILGYLCNHEVIYKTISSFCTATNTIFTNNVTSHLTDDNFASIALAPGIFQQLIRKRHELRITVIDDNVFVVKINSQLHNKSSLDWRRYPVRELYELGALSQDTKEKLLKFHRSAGLVFATYDFIVDDDNQEIFLECNPAGQWLWLEENTNLAMSTCMANILKGSF